LLVFVLALLFLLLFEGLLLISGRDQSFQQTAGLFLFLWDAALSIRVLNRPITQKKLSGTLTLEDAAAADVSGAGVWPFFGNAILSTAPGFASLAAALFAY